MLARAAKKGCRTRSTGVICRALPLPHRVALGQLVCSTIRVDSAAPTPNHSAYGGWFACGWRTGRCPLSSRGSILGLWAATSQLDIIVACWQLGGAQNGLERVTKIRKTSCLGRSLPRSGRRVPFTPPEAARRPSVNALVRSVDRMNRVCLCVYNCCCWAIRVSPAMLHRAYHTCDACPYVASNLCEGLRPCMLVGVALIPKQKDCHECTHAARQSNLCPLPPPFVVWVHRYPLKPSKSLPIRGRHFQSGRIPI
jgi:hypothetical protein